MAADVKAQPAPSVVDLLGVAESPLGDVAAPRISIHIFCEQEDTAAAANDAAQDRRMARASTSVFMGECWATLVHEDGALKIQRKRIILDLNSLYNQGRLTIVL